MDDDQLDRIMDGWVREEERAAGALHPTDEMRQLVEARRAAAPRSAVSRSWKWLVAGAAAAAIAAFVGRAYIGGDPETPEADRVSVRAPEFGRGALDVEGPAPLVRSPKKGGHLFAQLLLQTNAPGTRTLVGVEHEGAGPVSIPLGADDFFRLALHPWTDLHVAVYRTSREDAAALRRLVPAGDGPRSAQLVPGGQLRFLPAEPDWFRFEEEGAGHRLWVVSSKDPFVAPEAVEGVEAFSRAASGDVPDVREFIFRAR